MSPDEITTVDEANAAIQRLCKWRSHFAGWLLGTRSKADPQSQWARDTGEKLVLLRAEVSALVAILVDAGVTDAAVYTIQVGKEAAALDEALQRKWPGVHATDEGLEYDIAKIGEAGWMRGWLP